jgi:hypothetical protein
LGKKADPLPERKRQDVGRGPECGLWTECALALT